MHARVVKISGWASEEVGRRFIAEQVVPGLSGLEGFAAGYWLYDRGSNKALAITLWETEEALRASDKNARQIREDATKQINAQFEGVDEYEVIYQAARARTPSGSAGTPS